MPKFYKVFGIEHNTGRRLNILVVKARNVDQALEIARKRHKDYNCAQLCTEQDLKRSKMYFNIVTIK